jgi:hypothetical protein
LANILVNITQYVVLQKTVDIRGRESVISVLVYFISYFYLCLSYLLVKQTDIPEEDEEELSDVESTVAAKSEPTENAAVPDGNVQDEQGGKQKKKGFEWLLVRVSIFRFRANLSLIVSPPSAPFHIIAAQM